MFFSQVVAMRGTTRRNAVVVAELPEELCKGVEDGLHHRVQHRDQHDVHAEGGDQHDSKGLTLKEVDPIRLGA